MQRKRVSQSDINSAWTSQAGARITVKAFRQGRVFYEYDDGDVKLSPSVLPERLFLAYFERVGK